MSEPFIAEIRIFAGNFAPRGWAFCDGQLLPIAQNTTLFSLIGTTYGGDGRTTTALPNMKGRAPMHPGRGPGLTDRRLGQKGGEETTTLSQTQIPAHSHPLKGSDEDASSNNPKDKVMAAASEVAYANPGTVAAMSPQAMATSGGGSQPHNNMQPFLTMYYIIALVGIYPSRS